MPVRGGRPGSLCVNPRVGCWGRSRGRLRAAPKDRPRSLLRAGKLLEEPEECLCLSWSGAPSTTFSGSVSRQLRRNSARSATQQADRLCQPTASRRLFLRGGVLRDLTDFVAQLPLGVPQIVSRLYAEPKAGAIAAELSKANRPSPARRRGRRCRRRSGRARSRARAGVLRSIWQHRKPRAKAARIAEGKAVSTCAGSRTTRPTRPGSTTRPPRQARRDLFVEAAPRTAPDPARCG